MMTLALALLLAFAARNSKVKHDEEKGDGRDHMVDDLDAPQVGKLRNPHVARIPYTVPHYRPSEVNFCHTTQ